MTGERVDPGWAVRDGGLAWRGGWFSAAWLAELLSGEDEGRVSEDDVRVLLDHVAAGLRPNRCPTCNSDDPDRLFSRCNPQARHGYGIRDRWHDTADVTDFNSREAADGS